MIDPISIANKSTPPAEVNPRVPVKMLGQNDFLKLLVTQMQNQDPLSPMQDTEFIAQMAQFSSLEQSREMSENMAELRAQQGFQQAVGLIGKNVTVSLGEGAETSGIVSEVETAGDTPKLVINGRSFDLQDVIHVSATDGINEPKNEE